MIYIIFDLETIFVRHSKMVGNIVEIGAVKVKEEKGSLSIVDKFHTYVKTPIGSEIDKRTLKFIGAEMQDFRGALPLREASASFRKWIGNEEYYTCTWSTGDPWILAENRLTRYFDVPWFKNYNDIQPAICKAITGEGSLLALKRATKMKVGEPKSNQFHSAIYDAFCTTLLFIECFDEIKDSMKTNKNTFNEFTGRVLESQRKREEKEERIRLKNVEAQGE